MTSKNDLQRFIFTYKQRRQEVRDKLGPGRYDPTTGRGWYKHPEYKKLTARLYRSIQNYQARLRRLEAWQKQIEEYDIKTTDFFALPRFKGCLKGKKLARRGKEDQLARAMFYKLVLENTKIRPVYLADYVGASRPGTPAEVRRNLTRRFAAKPEQKATYYRLLNYCKEVTVAEIKERFLGIKDIHLEAA